MSSNFPVECFEEIFRHLSEKDLLRCCLVGPEWNDFIGSTSWCMKKIKFVYFNYCPMAMEGILMKSKRKYTCLKLSGHFFSGISKNVLRLREWTHVACSGSSFDGLKQFLDFLRIFQFSVQELIIDSGRIEGGRNAYKIEFSDLNFPNLKTLQISADFVEVYDYAFANCKYLTSLSISMDAKTPWYALVAIESSLKSNKELKKLKIDGSLVFKEDFSSTVSFKLTEISVTFKMHTFQLHPNFNLFNLFLKTQSDTLESLEVNGWPSLIERPGIEQRGECLVKSLLSMPRLKKMSLGKFHLNGIVADTLPQNNSVTSLILKDCKNEISVLKIFVDRASETRNLENH